MAQKLRSYQSVNGVKGIHVVDDDSLRCTAVALKGGDLCLYNPVKGLDSEYAMRLQELGQIKYLLSPNHYHNRALREYADQFGEAITCASTAASPRLQRVTRLEFASLTGLKRRLPASIAVIETKGLKTGEVWLRIKTGKDVCWLVGDAFCGPRGKGRGLFSATPELLKPFPKYGIGNRDQYLDWVKTQIDKDSPTTIVPCHGGMIRSKRLPQKLLELVSTQI